MQRAVALEFVLIMIQESRGPGVHPNYGLQREVAMKFFLTLRSAALEFFLTIITESRGPGVLSDYDYREKGPWSSS